MRILKLAILSFVFFFLLMTVISFFLPSEIRITKTEQINSTKEFVMEQISDPAKWKNWYPGLDSAELFYSDSIVKGFVQNKKKEQVIVITGQGKDEVMMEYRVSGKKKIAGGWKLTAADGSVMIQWYMTLHVRWYPWEKFAGLLYERSFATQMKAGLIKLKEIAETK